MIRSVFTGIAVVAITLFSATGAANAGNFECTAGTFETGLTCPDPIYGGGPLHLSNLLEDLEEAIDDADWLSANHASKDAMAMCNKLIMADAKLDVDKLSDARDKLDAIAVKADKMDDGPSRKRKLSETDASAIVDAAEAAVSCLSESIP